MQLLKHWKQLWKRFANKGEKKKRKKDKRFLKSFRVETRGCVETSTIKLQSNK